MPKTNLILFKEDDGSIPVITFLDDLPAKSQDKAIARFELLQEKGHELRRPYADFLDDGIYELRFRVFTVQYRFLYFYSGVNVVIVSHGLTKEDNVPKPDIELALKRRTKFETNPAKHTAAGTEELKKYEQNNENKKGS